MFIPFPKIPRLERSITITEKIDGTYASVWIVNRKDPDVMSDWSQFLIDLNDTHAMFAGSRKRFITPDNDNFGFAKWVSDNSETLWNLGEGIHHGEWWGQGIQRTYGLDHKRFSLFNTSRWGWLNRHGTTEMTSPSPLHGVVWAVPLISVADSFDKDVIDHAFELLRGNSYAARGFGNPEGIVVYHSAANQLFKKTYEFDETGKDNA